MERHLPADLTELFEFVSLFPLNVFTVLSEYYYSRVAHAIPVQRLLSSLLKWKLSWVTWSNGLGRAVKLCTEGKEEQMVILPSKSALCTVTSSAVLYVITSYTAAVREYLPFLWSHEFCHVSLLQAPGVWSTYITQTCKYFEVHPSVCEKTKQRGTEVSSIALSCTISKTHLSFIETTSHKPAFAKFLCWLGWSARTRGSIQDCRTETGIFLE